MILPAATSTPWMTLFALDNVRSPTPFLVRPPLVITALTVRATAFVTTIFPVEFNAPPVTSTSPSESVRAVIVDPLTAPPLRLTAPALTARLLTVAPLFTFTVPPPALSTPFCATPPIVAPVVACVLPARLIVPLAPTVIAPVPSAFVAPDKIVPFVTVVPPVYVFVWLSVTVFPVASTRTEATPGPASEITPSTRTAPPKTSWSPPSITTPPPRVNWVPAAFPIEAFPETVMELANAVVTPAAALRLPPCSSTAPVPREPRAPTWTLPASMTVPPAY